MCVASNETESAYPPPPLFPIIAQLSLLELFRDAERVFELTSTAEIFIDWAKTFITSIRMFTDPNHVRMSFEE